MIAEKNLHPISGYTVTFISLALVAGVVTGIFIRNPFIIIPCLILFALLLPGYFIVNPNDSKVLILFGKYAGTVKQYGFHWANPFYTKKRISLRARNLDGEKIKVNDLIGNPIIIGAVIVWQVEDTAKAAFEVDSYEHYVSVQSDAAVRNLAGLYPYDNFDDDHDDHNQDNDKGVITLRSGGSVVNERLEKELGERLDMAGIKIIEARITHLAYSEEIASAMLQRQQATAIIAARKKIVEGAVSMVEDALEQLAKGGIVNMDDERKAAMISNLMVVLCADKSPTPVVNTGTLYH
ncbi:MAG: SPFH domain-containing protein [Chitinophagales bacterium]